VTDIEIAAILNDQTKRIDGDISWSTDEDHSPAVEFRVDVLFPELGLLSIKGSFNQLAQKLSYVLIHRGVGRIYALDLGSDHHNPDCHNVGEKHKHRWSEKLRDKEAYVPEDITEPASEPVAVWIQFCEEAGIVHNGKMLPPPPKQMNFFP
jgi:hypothetical protein